VEGFCYVFLLLLADEARYGTACMFYGWDEIGPIDMLASFHHVHNHYSFGFSESRGKPRPLFLLNTKFGGYGFEAMEERQYSAYTLLCFLEWQPAERFLHRS